MFQIFVWKCIFLFCVFQLTARREQEERARKRDDEDYRDEMKADEDYEEFLRQETERMRLKGFTPRVSLIG